MVGVGIGVVVRTDSEDGIMYNSCSSVGKVVFLWESGQ